MKPMPNEFWTAADALGKARDEITALRARLAEVEKERDGWLSASVDQQKRAQRAEAALATAREDAYEQAAQVVDARKSIIEVGTELSSRIRALKDAKP
jgi:predicted  nucleic acid-binding Zn-ribbon protein